ncbi:hypothetical protein T12_13675, partial [Trichinella patagoniensis]
LNFKMVLIGRIEQCISPVHTVLRHRLEFILKEKFQCTKTGFQRCAMQISIAIKGALSSIRAHSFRCAMQITIVIKGALSSVRAHSFV